MSADKQYLIKKDIARAAQAMLEASARIRIAIHQIKGYAESGLGAETAMENLEGVAGNLEFNWQELDRMIKDGDLD